MSAVSFAQRLYQFPLGVFGIAVATAIFPALARQAADPEAFTDILRRGLRLVVFIGLPASAGLMLVGKPLATVILQGGDFSADDSARVAFVLMGYATAVWAYSMIHVLTRAFYAVGNAKTPVKIAVSMVGLNLILNCTLIWTPLREAGLAWSTAICATLQAAMLLWCIQRRTPHTVSAEVISSWTKSIIVTSLMFVIAWIVLANLPAVSTWSESFAHLIIVVFVGMLVVFSAAGAFRMSELWWALGKRGA